MQDEARPGHAPEHQNLTLPCWGVCSSSRPQGRSRICVLCLRLRSVSPCFETGAMWRDVRRPRGDRMSSGGSRRHPLGDWGDELTLRAHLGWTVGMQKVCCGEVQAGVLTKSTPPPHPQPPRARSHLMETIEPPCPAASRSHGAATVPKVPDRSDSAWFDMLLRDGARFIPLVVPALVTDDEYVPSTIGCHSPAESFGATSACSCAMLEAVALLENSPSSTSTNT